MLTIRELEILKTALTSDIMRQTRTIKEMDEKDSRLPLFEEWLMDTKRLCKKVTMKLMTEQARKGINNV